MQVPLLDLKQQYAALAHEILPAVEQVLASQMLINGPAVGEFEKAVAAYAHCAQAVGVSSGTDALLCALMALCIGPDDEVITSPFTFFATAGCIWRVGAKPVFADIDPQTFNMNPAAIEAAITPRTRAIMPVHLFGQMADMDAIMAIARRHHLAVIEDAAQSIGATYRGRHSGSIGTMGCFSFFPSKNLGGAGDGGMIVTQDNALAQRLRMFRNHGMEPKYYHACIGGNFRLDTIQAAYLHIKLKHLDAWSAKRRENAALYTSLLADCPAVSTPIIQPENVSIFNQYVIRTAKRDELKNYLGTRGIGTEIYYPLCLHQQECFKSLGHRAGDFPLAEQAAAEVLAIPIYPELTHQQIHYVARAIKEFFL
ncbi:MAG: DegT/DnrJ/EryC1/StrS family aminotransferase [Phycisphaerales bacterium]|nr:DegT/DnrJ/EryC1/StrS family aminotransferase [Phycisphaerales bacterium]